MAEILLHSFSRTISENVVDAGAPGQEFILSAGTYRLAPDLTPPSVNRAYFKGDAPKSPLNVSLQVLASKRANNTVPEPETDQWQDVEDFTITVKEPAVYRLYHAAGSKGSVELFQLSMEDQ